TLPAEADLAAVCSRQTADHVEERRLARAVRSDESGDRALPDRQRAAREGQHAAKALGDAGNTEQMAGGGVRHRGAHHSPGRSRAEIARDVRDVRGTIARGQRGRRERHRRDRSVDREGGAMPTTSDAQKTNTHWGRDALDRRILAALAAAGKDVNALTIDDLA